MNSSHHFRSGKNLAQCVWPIYVFRHTVETGKVREFAQNLTSHSGRIRTRTCISDVVLSLLLCDSLFNYVKGAGQNGSWYTQLISSG